jgi:hypothetical protein
MKQTRTLFFLLILPAAIFSLVYFSGCANIIPPTGGPRDTLPPVLVLATPVENALNFKANRITLTFDEYIDLKEIHQNLLVSPVPKQDPVVESKLKILTIRIKDTLQPNTTYAINFGKAIRDINEGNILRNFTYVFSTGPYIDSMQLSGRVIVASTGKPDSTLIVMLHRKLDDSAVAKERPRYVARLDSSGNFLFRYIEPGTYAIYALEDDGNKKYTSKSQFFAFSDTPIVVRPNYSPLLLYAYNDTSVVKHTKKSPVASNAKKKEKDKRLMVQISVDQGEFDVLNKFQLEFKTPLKYFDSTKIHLTDDKYKDVPNYHFVLDSTFKMVTLVYKWPLETKYFLIAQKDFAEDTLGNYLLKADTISFHTKRENQYGTLRLRFYNLNLARHPILQFVQNDKIKFSRPLVSRDFYEPLMEPGEYQMRILYDENNNGVWDPGQFFGGHKQPEKVVPVALKLTIKGNWDNEKDINL